MKPFKSKQWLSEDLQNAHLAVFYLVSLCKTIICGSSECQVVRESASEAVDG